MARGWVCAVGLAATVGVLVLCGRAVLGGGAGERDHTQLPYCPPRAQDDSFRGTSRSRPLVFVSTLDGTFSALDPSNGGALIWSVETTPGDMLSSSLSTLEYSHKGEKVRLIPSLHGALYKFNGERIEPVPFTAETLLQSSFRFSDDTIVTGGKESRTYGIDPDSGQLRYECAMEGCRNNSASPVSHEEVLVLRRQTQTVRAVDPRSGAERWNFSIGQHELMFLGKDGCVSEEEGEEEVEGVVVVVPEGLVFGVGGKGEMGWKQRFSNPIVHAWQFQGGRLRQLNLFGAPPADGGLTPPENSHSPMLYIRSYNDMMYIQETRRLGMAAASLNWPQLTWKPYVPQENNPQLLEHHSSPIGDNKPTRSTALTVLADARLPSSGGFFLYSTQEEQQTDQMTNGTEEKCEREGREKEGDAEDDDIEFDEADTPVEIIIVGLGFWWKEVLIISVTSAVVMNVIITRPILRQMRLELIRDITANVMRFMAGQRTREIVVIPLTHTPSPSTPSIPSSSTATNSTHLTKTQRSTSSSLTSSASECEFRSRYLQDFDPIRCMGKGGFGLVCEAKNKIDDCHYAVKRICLPQKEESRQRVLREVKALAKLEHTNIVRYYNAWVETPPPGWQERIDRVWLASEGCNGNSGWETGLTSKLSSFPSPKGNCTESSSAQGKTDAWVENEKQLWSKTNGFIPSRQSLDNTHSESIVFDSKCTGDGPHNNNNNNDTEAKSEEFIMFGSRTSSPSCNGVVVNSSVVECSESSALPCKAYLYIQMQLCRKDSLQDWMKSNEGRDRMEAFHMFSQIVHAVEYIHLQGLIHRDLKPSNIFFSQDGLIKVGDFGLVTETPEREEELIDSYLSSSSHDGHLIRRHTDRVGTLLYMSPEQEKRKPYNHKVDIYSLGLILFELLVPFGTQMERIQTMTALRRMEFPSNFGENFSQEHKLLDKMLSHDPDERPTTYGIRASPTLRDFQDQSTLSDIPAEMHFSLPHRTPPSRSSSGSSA